MESFKKASLQEECMATQRIRAIVTDIDNTLFDSEGQRTTVEHLVANDAIALAPSGSRLRDANPEEVFTLYRAVYKELGADSQIHIDTLLALYGIPQPEFDDLRKILVDNYHQYRDHILRPFPGVKETLHLIQRHGVVLGALSNGVGSKQMKKLKLMGIDSMFHHFVVPETVQKQYHLPKEKAGKPHQVIYRAMHQLLSERLHDLQPEEVAYVDDRLDHCAGANRMGWISVQMKYGKYASQTPEEVADRLGLPLEQSRPRHEITSFEGLRKEVLPNYKMPKP